MIFTLTLSSDRVDQKNLRSVPNHSNCGETMKQSWTTTCCLEHLINCCMKSALRSFAKYKEEPHTIFCSIDKCNGKCRSKQGSSAHNHRQCIANKALKQFTHLSLHFMEATAKSHSSQLLHPLPQGGQGRVSLERASDKAVSPWTI